eukprot:g12415.t1
MAGVVAVDGQEVNLTYEPQSPMSNPYHHLTKDADAKPFVVGLVQARMGSTRLPGKVLLPLPKENGMPVLWHDFNRLKACKNVDKWVLATSTWHTDTVLEEFAKEHGILCFRGSEGDCMERIFTGAIAHGAKPGDYILRITSDCPLIDAGLVDQGVKECIEGNYDQFGLYDQYPRSTQYADGLDFQVFSYNGFAKMNKEAIAAPDREHVGPYMMDNPDKFRLGHMEFPIVKARNRNWTLDNPPDYEFLSEVYKHLWKGKEATEPFSIYDLMDLLDRKPELSDINHIPFENQNEGLLKSYRKKLLSEGINYEVAFNKRFETSKEMLQKANLGNRGEFFLPVMASKSNCYAVDVDGNEYIDLSLSNGMMSFGHAYEFNEGLKSSNSRLSYKNHGFADKISTLLKANRYSKKILSALSNCQDLNKVSYASSAYNAFKYIFASLDTSDRSIVLVDQNSEFHKKQINLMIQGFTSVFFNSQIDGDLEEKITENDGKICAVVYALLGKTEKDVNNCRKASSLASLPGKLIAFIVDEILTSGRVAFPSVACENNIRCDFHVLGPALANGRTFYPIGCNENLSKDTSNDIATNAYMLDYETAATNLTFEVASLAFEYFENRCVIFNLNRFLKSFTSGINSALMMHKMENQIKVTQCAGRLTFEYINDSTDEKNKFNKVMHDELLGRGIYLEGNVISTAFSVHNDILVRFALAFESALGIYKSSINSNM